MTRGDEGSRGDEGDERLLWDESTASFEWMDVSETLSSPPLLAQVLLCMYVFIHVLKKDLHP